MLSSLPRVQGPQRPTRTRDVRRQTTLWETSDIHSLYHCSTYHRMGHQLSWAGFI